MEKYYGYARVSTKDQSDYSLENQLKYLKIKADELHMDFIEYREKESGKSFSERPVLQEIKNKVQEGDVLGVYDNSRLGRDTQEALATVDDFIQRGVTVQIAGQNLDASVPRDRLLFTIESAISEFYRRDQNLKSRVGIEQKKENGEWLFTSRLLGYNLTYKGGKPVVKIVEEEAEVIRYIFNEYARGKSIRKITQDINAKGYRSRSGAPFHDASVRRYIHKPIYKGYYQVKEAGSQTGENKEPLTESKLVKSKYYPPIVSEELWNNVQQSYKTLRREHTIQFEYRYSYYELTSILKCYHCKQVGKATTYVHDYHKQKNSTRVNSNYVNRLHLNGCVQKFHTFRGWVLEAVFKNCFYLVFANIDEIGEFITQKRDKIDRDSDSIQKDINRIDKKMEELNRQKANLINAVEKGAFDIEDVQQRMDDIKKQLSDLTKHKTELQNSYWDIEEQFENLKEEYSEAMLLRYIKAENPAEKRKIYQELIESAYVFNGQIVIKYTNSKVFIIPIRRNKGRSIQNEFKIKVHFMSKYQYTITYNAVDDKMTLTHVPIRFSITNEDDNKLKEAFIKRRENEITGLREKIDEYKEIEVASE